MDSSKKRYACYPNNEKRMFFDWEAASIDMGIKNASIYLKPKIKYNDIIMFSNLKPHASFFPKDCKYSRMSLDLRISTLTGERTKKALELRYPDLRDPAVFTKVPGQNEVY